MPSMGISRAALPKTRRLYAPPLLTLTLILDTISPGK